mgnify:CR=1 FL=1
MTVLGDAACQQYRERHDSGRIEGYEDHVRTRFRDYADQCCQQYHEYCIAADPSVNVDILEHYAQKQENTEGPCKDCRQMSADNMIPQMFFDKMIGTKKENEKHDDA